MEIGKTKQVKQFKIWIWFFLVTLSVIGIVTPNEIRAQQLAFPSAEGYGRYTTGGRGGKVIEVTNLNDSGIGSLRAAVQANGVRTVVFRVSGIIGLNSDLRIQNDNITIAGQTAPGDGICIKNYPVSVDADNVIIRYIRFRLGDEKNVEADALGGRYHKNIIIDHCSASWSVDECVSFYQNENLTLQWCLISESLYESIHEKGTHGYGGIWGGKNCTFHHNLMAHHSSRNPRFASNDGIMPEKNVDSRNNVIYNWGYNSCYGGEGSSINVVANYYKYGPATGPKDRIAEPSSKAGLAVGEWYIEENYVFGYPEITADNWAGGVQGPYVTNARIYEILPYAPVVTHSAEIAYQLVLADAGAVRPKRDSLDTRVVWETKNQTALYGASYGAGTGIIDTPSDVGGWPVLKTYNQITDNDHDGMADDWETEYGLNPSDPADRNGDMRGEGYTNLEYYLNSMCLRWDYLAAPAGLEAFASAAVQVDLTWVEVALNESGFVIERSEGDTTGFVQVGTADVDHTFWTDMGLTPLTTYYYRIYAFNDSVRSLYSNYATVKTANPDGTPLIPENPNPCDNCLDVAINTVLKWDKTSAATSYDVYFGKNNTEPEFQLNQSGTSFNPYGLEDSTVYFWRIDAVNDFGKTTGPVWRFTSENIREALIGLWPLDRVSARVVDETGNGNYAYLMNMVSSNWIDGGISGKALQFDGVDDYLLIYNDDLLTFSIRSFTISFWIKQSIKNKSMPWISKAVYESGIPGARYEIFQSSSGKVQFVLSDGVTESFLETADSTFAKGEWVMVTAVRDKDEKKIKLYTDSTLISESPDSTYDLTQKANIYLGTNVQQNEFFEGALDQISFYNYALDSVQIKDLYNNTLTAITNSEENIAAKFYLRNYPNPFNSKTTIEYVLPVKCTVKILIYSINGQLIDTLVDGQKTTGVHTAEWDASTQASGVYFINLEADQLTKFKKIVLLK